MVGEVQEEQLKGGRLLLEIMLGLLSSVIGMKELNGS